MENRLERLFEERTGIHKTDGKLIKFKIDKKEENTEITELRMPPEEISTDGTLIQTGYDGITSTGIYTSNKPVFKKNTLGDSEELNKMENNELMLRLIEKVEQSNQQIKSDLVESEKKMTEDRRESEKRIEIQRQLSEERTDKKFNETMDTIKNQNTIMAKHDEKIDNKLDKIDTKLDTKFDKMDTKIDTKLTDMQTEIRGTNKWIIGTCIATIIGIAAMIISIISFVKV